MDKGVSAKREWILRDAAAGFGGIRSGPLDSGSRAETWLASKRKTHRGGSSPKLEPLPNKQEQRRHS